MASFFFLAMEVCSQRPRGSLYSRIWRIFCPSTQYKGIERIPAILVNARTIQTKAAGTAVSPLDAVPALAAEAESVTDTAISVPEEPDVVVAAATKPTRLVESGHPSELSIVTRSLLT